MRNTPKPLILVIALLLFSAGTLTGWWGHIRYDYQTRSLKEKHAGQYGLINPLLECEGAEELISGELKSFRDKIEQLINREIEEKKATHIAVYFRDMNDGPWFGINEKEPFLPGSLLKLPVMIGYLKEAESDPGIMEKKLTFDRRFPVGGQYIKPSSDMEYGKSYTVEELIYRMIAYSDNNAVNLLLSSYTGSAYNMVFTDVLSISSPYDPEAFDIGVKKYASLFRILFNASFLGKEGSNTALRILSSAEFTGGLVAGVPSNITVAHKFGESKSKDYQKQFHDCGIVYYPKNPYLLCVMSKGNKYGDLVSVIKDVSKLTYEEVDSQVRQNDTLH